MSIVDSFGIDLEPLRIGILPLPGFALMSYASTVEPFRAANLLSRQPLYELIHFGREQMTDSSVGATVPIDHNIGDMPQLDMLLVIAGGDPVAFDDAKILSWLRRMARRDVLMGGVSGGPVVLAKAGLMTGRRMTVHWEHAPALAEMSPNLLIERSLYVMDRDRVTCAGGTAPMDLMHAIIARDYGPVFAQLVSDWFLHTDIRPSGGAQRSGLVARVGTTAGPVLEAVEAMENHIADTITLQDLAAAAGVSARHLSRLFQDRLGARVMGYYRDIRLDVAEGLLTNSSMPLTEIALATGFANSSHFSRAYSLRHGAPPSARRRS